MFKDLLNILEERFKSNMDRHNDLDWTDIKSRLENNTKVLSSLNSMELSGGEPDVVKFENGKYIFFDCSVESPVGRRSLCYDREALDGRKSNKPRDSVMDMVESMGIELLDEEDYIFLQSIGHFDNKTSSWLLTPSDIRVLGGAIFGDYRYGNTFIYHNGADSYYSSRGFRGKVII